MGLFGTGFPQVANCCGGAVPVGMRGTTGVVEGCGAWLGFSVFVGTVVDVVGLSVGGGALEAVGLASVGTILVGVTPENTCTRS